MPIYTFKLPTDGTLVTKRLSFADYESVKSGESKIVDNDGNALELVFNPGNVGFVLKDGESGGWATKADKENRLRKTHTARMAKKEKDHVFKTRLIPNFQGQEAPTWTEVQSHVRGTSGDKAAKSYDKLVRVERSNQ